MALSGLLVDGGWREVYLALAAIILVVVVPLTLCLRRKVPPEALATADAISNANRHAVAIPLSVMKWLLAAAGIGCCVAMAMPQVHVVSFAADLGCTPAVGAQVLSVMLLGGVVSRIIFGVIADRLGGVKTLIISSLLQTFALSLYLPLNGVSALFAVSLIFGLSQGGSGPSYAIIVREYFPARQAGTVIGFVISATILGMALGGWLSGYIYDVTGSYTLAFVNGIAWNTFNVIVMLLILSRTGRPDRLAPA